MTMLEKLQAILVPPIRSLYQADADADARLRQIIGSELPRSYLEFLSVYGIGYICTEVHTLNFLEVYAPKTMLKQNDLFFRALDAEPREQRAYWPNVSWNEPGGWLIWGYSCDGHQYYWRMRGEPACWSIIVEDRYSDRRDEYDLSLPDFLADVLSRKIRPKGIPSVLQDPSERQVWKQYGEHDE